MRTLLAGLTAVLLTACGTQVGDEPDRHPASEGEWVSHPLAGEPAVDFPMVAATSDREALVVMMSDKGVLQSHVGGAAGFTAGPALRTDATYVGLGGAAFLDGRWVTLGTGGLAQVDGDEELLFEPVSYTSVDGLAWEEQSVEGFSAPADLAGLVAVDGSLVAAGAYRDVEDPSMGGFRPMVWTSEDGRSWTEVELPEAVADGNSYVSALSVVDGRLLATGSTDGHGMLWGSDDAGRTWTSLPDERILASYALSGLAVQGTRALVSTTPGDGEAPEILRSADRGDSWSVSAGQPSQDDIEGYAPLWAGGGRFFTLTSTPAGGWEDPGTCYADIAQCQEETRYVLHASEDGDTWRPVDTGGMKDDDHLGEIFGGPDGEVLVLGQTAEGAVVSAWPGDVDLPVGEPAGEHKTVDLVTVPEDGKLEPGVRYHQPFYVHCGMDWLYLGDRAWRRTDGGPDLETGAGDAPDESWPVVGQTIYGYATLAGDVVEYSIGDGEVIATYEQVAQVPQGCD